MTHRRPEHFHIQHLKRTYNRQTGTFTINISYETAPTTLTQRTKEVAEAFGLGTDQTRQFTLYDNINIHIKPTDIVLITGDSGSGKSALLKALKADLGSEAQDTKDLAIDPNQPIIETVGTNTTDAIEALSQVGLNDAFLFLRPYQQLSDGQKHRYQTALLAQSQKPFWILDEFTSTLDRDTAKILAFNLQKQARKQGKAVIAATTHKDLQRDFAPNVHIHKRYGKEVTVQYHPKAKAQNCIAHQANDHSAGHKSRLQNPKPISLPRKPPSRTKKNLHPKTQKRALRSNRLQLCSSSHFWKKQSMEGQHSSAPKRNEHNQPRCHPPQVPQHRLRSKTHRRNPLPSRNTLRRNRCSDGKIQPVL